MASECGGIYVDCLHGIDHEVRTLPYTQVRPHHSRGLLSLPCVLRDTRGANRSSTGQPNIEKGGVARVFDSDLAAPTYRFIRGNEKYPETDKPLDPGVPAFFQAKLDIKPLPIPPEARYPDGREFVRRDLIHAAELEVEKAEAELNKAKEAEQTTDAQESVVVAEKQLVYVQAMLPAVKARADADRAKYREEASPDMEALSETARKLERQANIAKAEKDLFLATREMKRAAGNEKKLAAAKTKLEEAAKALGTAKDTYTPLGTLYPESTSGRRLALAKWITSRDNPLTARVAINHMWLRHFGTALVPTVFNFGKSGKPASHPELLDWLAVEFMDHGWDMKHIHRLLVTSDAYKMRSNWKADDPNVAIDPDNIYLWRMNPRRMEAEVVRDSLLTVAGKLDATMGGPDIDETKAESVFRKSIYFRHSADLQVEMLKVFDVASPNECFERTSSIVPQQALALSNSDLSFSASRWIAASIRDGAVKPGPAKLVDADFNRILGRSPAPAELTESVRFLESQSGLYKASAGLTAFQAGATPSVKPAEDPDERAFQSFVHALLNHNDFVTIR